MNSCNEIAPFVNRFGQSVDEFQTFLFRGKSLAANNISLALIHYSAIITR